MFHEYRTIKLGKLEHHRETHIQDNSAERFPMQGLNYQQIEAQQLQGRLDQKYSTIKLLVQLVLHMLSLHPHLYTL